MSTDFLLQQLYSIENAKRVNRERVANIVSEQPELMEPLVEITFRVDDKISIKAAWILEWVCIHVCIERIIPYLDSFTENLKSLKFDSSIRPCSKICESLATNYTSSKNNSVKEFLQETHIENLIETGFDWLITPQKIAVRAYTMNTLYLLGTLPRKEWVHPELENLIRTKIIHEGKGCKARGRHILEQIEKFKKSHS